MKWLMDKYFSQKFEERLLYYCEHRYAECGFIVEKTRSMFRSPYKLRRDNTYILKAKKDGREGWKGIYTWRQSDALNELLTPWDTTLGIVDERVERYLKDKV